jgi:AcrR family transcriptional regulator
MPLYDPPPDDPKEARFHAVARAVVDILVQRGQHAVSVSATARKAGVSRAWIYKHFGSDTDALIDFTIRELGGLVAGADLDRGQGDLESWREALTEATQVGLRHAEVAPWGASLFFRYRNQPGRLGDAVRMVEARHVQRFVDAMPPVLRSDHRAADRFARVFAVARLGTYVWWSDPAVRATQDADAVLTHLFDMLDGYVRRTLQRGS